MPPGVPMTVAASPGPGRPGAGDPAGPARPSRPALPERPVLSTPDSQQSPAVLAARRRTISRQPALGLAGLLLVLPIAALLAFAVDGPERSVLVLAPIVTFALPPVAMVAFWWDDWPGTAGRPAWSGWLDTVLIAVLAVVFTGLGQLVAGRFDLRGLFIPMPGAGHAPTFPAVLPLAGAAFVLMLQLTLVNEGWPLRRLPRIPGGLLALAVSWGLALAVYYGVVAIAPPPGSGLSARHGFMAGGDLGALLVVIGVWQVWWYIAWRGWPLSRLRQRWLRLPLANAVTIGGGILSYFLIRQASDIGSPQLTSIAGCIITAGLLVSMLFDGAVRPHLSAVADRVVVLLTVAAVAAGLYFGLTAYADTVNWIKLDPAEWVTHAALNSLAVSVILHVAVGRRWPFARPADAPD
jgi:hypothetical protein